MILELIIVIQFLGLVICYEIKKGNLMKLIFFMLKLLGLRMVMLYWLLRQDFIKLYSIFELMRYMFEFGGWKIMFLYYLD